MVLGVGESRGPAAKLSAVSWETGEPVFATMLKIVLGAQDRATPHIFMNIKNLGHWIRDYTYFVRGESLAFLYRKPPAHYLGHVVHGKQPIILISGIFSKWQFLKAVADPLSLRGHPIYVVESIGWNTKEVHHIAKLIRELIEEKNLQHVVIIAHSKGGLIGKYLLVFHNEDKRIEKVIAIATPFHGSAIVKLLPFRVFKGFAPEGEIIRTLSERTEVNHRIVSIFGVFDNHVWPVSSCYLEEAKNIQVEVHGHHKIIFNKKIGEIIAAETG